MESFSEVLLCQSQIEVEIEIEGSRLRRFIWLSLRATMRGLLASSF